MATADEAPSGELNPAASVDAKDRSQSHPHQRSSDEEMHRHTEPASAGSVSPGYTTTFAQAGSSNESVDDADGRTQEFICPTCQRRFHSVENLNRHKLTHMQGPGRVFVCSRCGKGFSRRENRDRHMDKHKFRDGTPMSLASHWDGHAMEADGGINDGDESIGGLSEDAEDDPRGYADGGMDGQISEGLVCSSETTTSTQVFAGDGHVRAFVCPVISCGRLFKRAEHFERHIRTHTEEGPYTCPICGKRFTKSENLARHFRTHKRIDGTPTPLAGQQDEYATETDGVDESI